MAQDWKWWASHDGEYFSVGPCGSRDSVLDEAETELDWAEDTDENGQWYIPIHIIEASGTYYDCDECGRVEKACKECVKTFLYDEPAFYFLNVRNEEYVKHIRPVEPAAPKDTANG